MDMYTGTEVHIYIYIYKRSAYTKVNIQRISMNHYPLAIYNIAIKDGPFIYDVPVPYRIICDFPVRFLYVYQRAIPLDLIKNQMRITLNTVKPC